MLMVSTTEQPIKVNIFNCIFEILQAETTVLWIPTRYNFSMLYLSQDYSTSQARCSIKASNENKITNCKRQSSHWSVAISKKFELTFLWTQNIWNRFGYLKNTTENDWFKKVQAKSQIS